MEPPKKTTNTQKKIKEERGAKPVLGNGVPEEPEKLNGARWKRAWKGIDDIGD